MTNLESSINLISAFCGVRDVPELYGIDQADVMVLFGGSVLAGADVFADAINQKIAKKFVIAGGVGHTTEAFCRTVNELFPSVKTAGLSEAEVFQNYLKEVHDCEADLLETKSTNCGENIANLLALLEKEHIPCSSIILCHDATMQRRIGATLERQMTDKIDIINYAAYQMDVKMINGKLEYAKEVLGMWEMDHYLSLVMGEIQRLTDDKNGYGPKGRDFIAHVDVPNDVTRAFNELKEFHPLLERGKTRQRCRNHQGRFSG